MPRHRIETPRSRTLWPAAVQSARRVPLSAAGRRVTPGHAKPAVVPEWRQRLTRNQRRMLNQAGRRLLVSPWFAAGAGVVIATGAVIYMPHAQLDPAITITHCKPASCKEQFTPQGGAPPMPAGAGVPVHSSPSVTVSKTVWYEPPGHSTQSEFSMWIKVQVPRSLQWKLSFSIPGATGVYVYGVPRWRPYGTDGVLVSSYNAGTESSGYAPLSGHQDSDEVWPSANGDTVLFQVRGTGWPSGPASCTFNEEPCQFKLSHDLAPASWPSP